MPDLYDYYESLLPPMADTDFDALPSPRQILEAVHSEGVDNVGTIPIIATGREHHVNYYVVVKLGSEYVKISCPYHSDSGFSYDYDVQIVKPQERLIKGWTPV
jgi:hypothetical protein